MPKYEVIEHNATCNFGKGNFLSSRKRPTALSLTKLPYQAPRAMNNHRQSEENRNTAVTFDLSPLPLSSHRRLIALHFPLLLYMDKF